MPTEPGEYNWPFLDDETKVTVLARGKTFEAALAAAGYVNDLGRFVKAKPKPEKAVAAKPVAPETSA